VLEPLVGEAREELVTGLAPGLPDAVQEQIRERAEGIPLYAVETVRMLLDRGLVVREDGAFRLTGPVESLEVPETLHALIAARLDGLEAVERRLLEDAAVLGKTFTKRALGAVSGNSEEDLDPLLASLVRKEVLTLEADPRSPERGQYGFLHALFQKVAYDTLSRRERKARHLAVAAYFEDEWGPEDSEVVEMVASHYLEAYRASPDAEDAAGIKARACARLARAAERAASLAASEEAYRRYEEAAELEDDPPRRGELLERAGEAARASGRLDAAERALEQAVALFESAGALHPAARATARLGSILYDLGRLDEGIARMEQSFEVLAADEPDGDLATLAHELARLYMFAGNDALHEERVELALEVSETLELPEIISQALNTKAMLLHRRPHESSALIREALDVALEHDLTSTALRAYNNLAFLSELNDHLREGRTACEDGIGLARRRGDRTWEWILLSNLISFLFRFGDWDEAVVLADEVPDEARDAGFGAYPTETLAQIHVIRGDLDSARPMALLMSRYEASSDLQARGMALLVRASLLAAEGNSAVAAAVASEGAEALASHRSPYLGDCLGVLVDAGLAAGDPATVEEGLARSRSVGLATPTLRAHQSRLSARLAAHAGESERVQPGFKAAEALFRQAENAFWLAVTLLDHGEWLLSEQRDADAEPLLTEAREIFERLKVAPRLEHLGRLSPTQAVAG
jgi:tetratricopeptide (TPR) repeat protein